MAFFFILAGAVIRVFSHAHFLPYIPNFAPITAMALFGGVYFNKKYALLIPLLALFLGDIFIGLYNPWVMISVYGSFLIVGLIGLWLKKHKKIPVVLGATLGASLLFFIITNFAMWAIPHSLYPHTLAGLVNCYAMGLPFFKNTLAGDLFYVGAMFGLMEGVLRFAPKFSKELDARFERIARKRI